MMPDQPPQLLPWSNTELEFLLLDLVSHGTETPKADCKLEIDTTSHEGKAEVLKDITAIANTYGDEYNDYGFLIYGATGKMIVGVSKTQTNTDQLQSHLEQLIKTYIAPMPQIYVMGFTAEGGEHWGAIVIPPRNTKPYMFVKEIRCSDPRRSRRRGDWFVRRGTTTDVGLPEDLARISQKQMELALEPLRESLRSLQSRIVRTEEQYTSALFRLIEKVATGTPDTTQSAPESKVNLDNEIAIAMGSDLPSRLRRRLRKPADILANDLIAEAMRLHEYIENGAPISWAPQPTDIAAAANKAAIEAIEDNVRPLLASIAAVVLDDSDGTFTNALLRVVRILARSGVNSGVFNQIGPAVRDYPLALLLYAAFICGAYVGSGDILKQILSIPLRDRSGDRRSNILDVFFRVHRAKELFNTALGGRWCEPVALRIRQVIDASIGDLFPGTPEQEYFFRGEFVLALAPIDFGLTHKKPAEQIGPLPGLYLYYTEANDVVRDFLAERPEWLMTLYRNPLLDILTLFDRNAQKVVSFECFGTGVYGLNTASLYQSTQSPGEV